MHLCLPHIDVFIVFGLNLFTFPSPLETSGLDTRVSSRGDSEGVSWDTPSVDAKCHAARFAVQPKPVRDG